jgi:hypothetical protein
MTSALGQTRKWRAALAKSVQSPTTDVELVTTSNYRNLKVSITMTVHLIDLVRIRRHLPYSPCRHRRSLGEPDAGRNRPDRKAVREHYRRTADDIKCTVTVIQASALMMMPVIATVTPPTRLSLFSTRHLG